MKVISQIRHEDGTLMGRSSLDSHEYDGLYRISELPAGSYELDAKYADTEDDVFVCVTPVRHFD
ncbi:MAG: hypothetical protein QM811_16545 [Pirellulales bacterium]